MKTVLIADDQPEILEVFETLLSGHGDQIRVQTALNGREAIERLAAEPIDLVVTDLTMPVVDGFQVLAHLMRNYPSIPVIVMTAYGSPTTRRRVTELGPLIYVEKPFDPTDLVNRIRTVLRETARGRVEGVTLDSFLQLLHLERKSCSLRVDSQGRNGLLKLASGELVDAQYGGRRGKAAAFEILGWEGVEIRMDPNARPSERTIENSLEHVLLEAAELRDEARWAETDARCEGERAPDPPEPIELAFCRLAAGFTSAPAGIEGFLQSVGETLNWGSAVLWTKVSGQDFLRCEGIWSRDRSLKEALDARREIDLTTAIEAPARAWIRRRAIAVADLEGEGARCGFRSAVVFPAPAGGQVLGVIELLDVSRRELGGGMIDWLSAFGSRIGGLLEHIRSDQRRADLIAREREALNRIYAREARLSFVAEASAVLACSLDEAVLCQTFLRLVVPRIAEWCVLDVMDAAAEPHVTIFHRDPAKLEWTEELRLRGSRASEAWSPVSRVLRTGVAEIYGGSALDRDASILSRLGFQSAMIVPIAARNRVLGTATLVSAPPMAPFGPEDLTMAQDLAHRLALAVDNARRSRSRDAAPRVDADPAETRSAIR